MRLRRAVAALVRAPRGRWLGASPWVYFVHSYAAPDGPDVVATCDHGGPVVAAVDWMHENLK